MHKLKHHFILGSSSKFRLKLLDQIYIQPDLVISPDIDETAMKDEKPGCYSKRIAIEKGLKIKETNKDSLIMSADTVISVGTRILNKPKDSDEARKHLSLLSGRQHRCYTTVCVLSPNGKQHVRQDLTMVKFKKLHQYEIDFYIATGEWSGCAGAYTISGYAGGFISSINGSYSSIVGLPIYDIRQIMLQYIIHE
jgi:septum formation protein